jgi:hypothetical protein
VDRAEAASDNRYPDNYVIQGGLSAQERGWNRLADVKQHCLTCENARKGYPL